MRCVRQSINPLSKKLELTRVSGLRSMDPDGSVNVQASECISHPLVIHVSNKSDLPCGKSPQTKSDIIRISAKSGQGVDNLFNAIGRCLCVSDFDFALPVAFTTRQEKLLLAIIESKEQESLRRLVTKIISE
jgi:50S ribosomal subunit-associated GTPase HflX